MVLGEEGTQCLYTSGSAASENTFEICQIFYQQEEGIARRGFRSVAAQHQLVLKLFHIRFVTRLAVLSC